MKKFFKKFCLDKKFNNICLTLLELPILIYCLISSRFGLLIGSCLILAILNFIIKKIYLSRLMKKLQKSNFIDEFLVDNFKKEDK